MLISAERRERRGGLACTVDSLSSLNGIVCKRCVSVIRDDDDREVKNTQSGKHLLATVVTLAAMANIAASLCSIVG